MKLGRHPSAPDHRDLKMAAYLTPSSLASSPPLRNWTRTIGNARVPFSLFKNDAIGCCTCSALGHIDQAAAAQTHRLSTFTDALVLAGYSAIGGYPARDEGASCRDALKFYKAHGEVELYVRLDDVNRFQVETGVNLGGALYVGVDLPLSAQKQTIWDVAPVNGWDKTYERRSWGGHAMGLLGYDRIGVWFVTWGRVQRATWSWLFTYCDEFWLVISDLWTDVGKLTPSGFDLERLRIDVARIAA